MREHHRSAFTLVELLVVIVIVVGLAALLMPAASRMTREAHKARCLGNLRQIAVACANYANDHNGRTVYSWYGEEAQPWPIIVAPYLGEIPNNKVWQCPAQPHVTTADKWPANWAGFTTSVDYAQPLINSNYAGGTPSYLLGAKTPLSKIVYLIEGRNIFWDQSSWDSQVAPYIGKHGSGANALFMDYHVESLQNPNFTQVRDANF